MGRKKSKKGKRSKRTLQKSKLIVCEGKTEQRYFQYMKEDKDMKQIMGAVNVKIVQANHPTPSLVVRYAEKLAREREANNIPYDTVWVVFDHDNYTDRTLAYEAAIKQKFKVAFSAMCFEEWYLLHFIKSTKAFKDCSSLIADLKKYYKDYQKTKQNDYAKLKDKLNIAKINAAWLRDKISETQSEKHITNRNPWTEIDILISDIMYDV